MFKTSIVQYMQSVFTIAGAPLCALAWPNLHLPFITVYCVWPSLLWPWSLLASVCVPFWLWSTHIVCDPACLDYASSWPSCVTRLTVSTQPALIAPDTHQSLLHYWHQHHKYSKTALPTVLLMVCAIYYWTMCILTISELLPLFCAWQYQECKDRGFPKIE